MVGVSVRGVSVRETPLNRDPPGQRPHLDRDQPLDRDLPEGTWNQAQRPTGRNMGPDS